MLSAQTKDGQLITVYLILSYQSQLSFPEMTFAACQRLKTIGLTPAVIAAADVGDLEKLLMPVSFYKTKAKHIKQASQRLLDEFDSDIPNTPESLMKLPGKIHVGFEINCERLFV